MQKIIGRITLFFLLFNMVSLAAKAQTESNHFIIHYVVDIADVDTTFMDNRERIAELREFLRTVNNDELVRIDSVKFTGTASPEGYLEFNDWLSKNRLENFKKLIREEIEIPDSIIFLNDNYITWKKFYDAVKASDIPRRDSVLAVLDLPPRAVPWNKNMHTDHRWLKLRAMDNGRVYETLKPILYYLRFADAEFILRRSLPQIPITLLNTEAVVPESTIWQPEFEYSKYIRRLYLKTNLAQAALLIANVAVEIDLARHWTFALPIFYSKWDYFRPEIRFRFAGFQPELRYWFNKEENDGWFIGAHFGYSYYNLGFNGAHRYQDLDGKTPTKGGGLAFGWRKQFGYKNRWRLEFSLGAGVYPLHYDVFENTHDYHNGKYLETRKKTYFGIDQAAVTIGYAFDLYNKEKRKLKGFVR